MSGIRLPATVRSAYDDGYADAKQEDAAAVALAEVIERLPKGTVLGRFDQGGWAVFMGDMERIVGAASTPVAAIDAALASRDPEAGK